MQTVNMNKLAVCLIAVGFAGGVFAISSQPEPVAAKVAATGDICAIAASFNGSASDRAIGKSLHKAAGCTGPARQ